MTLLTITDPNLLDTLQKESCATIIGAGGDLNTWIEGITGILKDQGVGEPQEWYTFKGSLMNEKYELSGSNKYPDDLTFLCFSLEGLNIAKLIPFKLQFGIRWFDDIIYNDLEREKEAAHV